MDVLVVGAGPVGLMMALSLVRQGVKVRVVDKALEPTAQSKALAVHARSLEVFHQVGLDEDFLEHGIKTQGMTAWLSSDKHALHVDFAELDSPYPYILDIPQSETERILGHHLRAHGVEVERGTELLTLAQSGSDVRVTLGKRNGVQETVRIPWVIGCDGAHSTVRHQLNLAFEGTQYPETFLLADVSVHWDLPEDRMQVFLHPDGMLAAFPYGRHRYRLMANYMGEQAPPIDDLVTLDEVREVVRCRSFFPAKVADPVWLTRFHSHLRHVKEMRHGRVFLAGDAAHIHSPAGGQGMNTGLQDAHNLAWKLAMVIRGKSSATLLDSYSVERMQVAESVLKLSDSLLKASTAENQVLQVMRNHLAPLILNVGAVQRRVRENISEVAVNYRNSSIVRSRLAGRFLHAHHHLHAGDRAPDADLDLEVGQSRRLFDYFRDGGHVLLVLAEDSVRERVMDGLYHLNPWLDEMKVCWVRSRLASGSLAGDGEMAVILDPRRRVAERYDLPDGGLVFVRPDGYIGYISDTLDFAPFAEYMSQVYSG